MDNKNYGFVYNTNQDTIIFTKIDVKKQKISYNELKEFIKNSTLVYKFPFVIGFNDKNIFTKGKEYTKAVLEFILQSNDETELFDTLKNLKYPYIITSNDNGNIWFDKKNTGGRPGGVYGAGKVIKENK